VFRTIGKKLMVVPSAILEPGPSPKNSTYSGKNRMIGTA
jgi:hypothetical protein